LSFLPALPPKWGSSPLKHACHLNPEVLPDSTPPDTELDYVDIAALEGGTADLSPKPLTYASAPSRARRVLRGGDTILSTVRTYLKAVATFPEVESNLIASTGFAVVRPNGRLHPRFAYWAVLSEPFIESVVAHSEGVSYPAINPSVLGSLHVVTPPAGDQVRIANFLDEQTARIDALIAEKERLRTALTEWRAAELTRICFGTDQPIVATGNAWIPALPKDWRLARLRHLVDGIEQGWSPECESRLADEDEWGVLKAGAANGGVYRQDEHKALPAALQPIPELEVKAGDVLITRASGTAEYVGSVAYVYSTRPKLMLSDKNFRLRFGTAPKLAPELLAWICNTRALREQVLQFVSGADGLAKNIGSGNLREIWLAVPPAAQQLGLIETLQARRAQLSDVEEHLVRHIDRLREYRSSLISAAVTGQIDINTYGAAT
jgi:type I restriction enzyme S subunit